VSFTGQQWFFGKEIVMSTFRETDHVTGWSAAGILATITVTRALTAFVISFPITWLVRHIFATAPLGFAFGADGFTYWRCVGLFAVWFAARVKIKFSGPAPINVEADR
jgi:hypothetical protein